MTWSLGRSMERTETGRIGQGLTLRRVLLFYAVGTLVALQFLHLAITYLLLPRWMGQIGFVLALIGLPFVLLGWLIRGRRNALHSWWHGDKKGRSVNRRRVGSDP
jgi:protein-S-isoprenylcysteine O-methyltransferase Ste14